MEYKFENDIIYNEELKQYMDSVLDEIQNEIEKDEESTTILNPIKLQQIQFAYAVLKYLMRGTDAVVSCKLNQPFKTMGSISVEDKSLEFTQPEWFSRAAEFASNTEVYPLAKNRVRLTFTFHGLTKPIE